MLGAADREDKDLGGIDMDPRKLKIQMEGSAPMIHLPQVPPEQLIPFDGFVPVLINISPIPNLPLLLGLSEDEGSRPPG